MDEGKIKRYPLLLVHLVASVVVVGGFFIYLLNTPFLILGRFSQPVWRVSTHITQKGLYVLSFFQPWWRGNLQVQLPERVKAGQQGCLCVANHRSHLDVFILLQQVRGIRVLTKHLIFWVPGLGLAAHLLRMIRIERGNEKSFWKSMQSLEKALRENHTVHVFPEMTRAEFGESQMGRFTLAPFQKAIQSGVPVVPIAIWGTDFLWPKGTYAIASSGPLVVKSLNPIDSRQFDSAANLSSHVKEVLQKEVDQLQAQFPYGTR